MVNGGIGSYGNVQWLTRDEQSANAYKKYKSDLSLLGKHDFRNNESTNLRRFNVTNKIDVNCPAIGYRSVGHR